MNCKLSCIKILPITCRLPLICSINSLTNVDFSVYVDELVPEHHKYVPWYRLCGGMIVDTEALAAKNLPVPASYDDLLKPEYSGA